MENDHKEPYKNPSILVIGNGFDLHCGLHSSFKDFFESELKLPNETYKYEKICSNIWYLIFTFAYYKNNKNFPGLVPIIENKDPLWMDVETLIDKVFKTNSSCIAELKIFDFINNLLTNKTWEYEFRALSRTFYLNGDDKNQIYLIKQRLLDLSYKNYKNASDLLFDEILSFEKDFINYLKNEIEKNKKHYLEKINDFLFKILDKCGLNELAVISFNYTSFIDEILGDDKVVHIHGTLNNDNIIIGIGDYEDGGMIGRDLFKKNKRRIKYNCDNISNVVKDYVKNIYFYGCSFSIQDEKYFHLLFNSYHLGEGKSRFIFLYSDYSNLKEENDSNMNKYYVECERIVNSYLIKNNINYKFDDLYDKGEIDFKIFE